MPAYPPGNLPASLSGDVTLSSGQYVANAVTINSGCSVTGVPGTIIKGNFRGDNKQDVTLRNLMFDGTGLVREGLRFINAKRLKVLDCTIYNFGGNGANVGGYNGTGDDVLFEGVTFYKNWPGGSGHCQGLYLAFTSNVRLRHCVFDTNGWNGTSGATMFNHGVYAHASCGPVLAEYCVFYNNSNYGMQQRSGGASRCNVFGRNATAHSFGYIKGSPVYTGLAAPSGWTGGVTGEITSNWYVGGRQAIGTTQHGWMVDLSNARDVTMSECYFSNDAINNHPAVLIKNCEQIDNPAQYLLASKWRLLVEKIYRNRGWLQSVDLSVPSSPTIIVRQDELRFPNQSAELGPILDAQMAQARQDPRGAWSRLDAAFRQVAGFVAPPTPPPDPVPPDTSGDSMGYSFERAIRELGGSMQAGIEADGRASVRFVQAGQDPLWYAEDNTLTPRN